MVSIIYLVLATAMFYLQDTYFLVGGVEFSLKNPCAIAIVFLALINFTATVRLGRFLLLVRHTAVQMLPCVVPFLFSSIIWVVSRADGIAIINGIGMIAPQILSIIVAAATLYLFGEKGIWYCLGAMCAANLTAISSSLKTESEETKMTAIYSKQTGNFRITLNRKEAEALGYTSTSYDTLLTALQMWPDADCFHIYGSKAQVAADLTTAMARA